MSKAQTNALLVLGAILVVGLVLAHSKNPTIRKFGRQIVKDDEDEIIGDLS